jgi:hypothetical protein
MYKITNVFKYNLLACSLMTCAVIYSCKKNIKAPETPPVVIVDPVITPPKPALKNYIPISFQYEKLIISLSYLEKSALLSEIKYTDGRSTRFKYNATKQLINYERFVNDKLTYSVDLSRNTEGLVIRANQFNVAPPRYTPIGYYTLSYNSTGQIIIIKFFDTGNKLKSEQNMEYFPSLDLSKKTTSVPKSTDQVISYQYDQKTGIYKHVLNLQLLEIEASDHFFVSGTNNYSSISNSTASAQNQSISYTYNENDYPAKYVITEGPEKRTYSVNYKALE